MSFPRYPAYKDCGIAWLGAIPAHWSVIPLARIASKPGSLFIDGDWVESKDLADDGIRYITTGNVGEGKYKEQGSGYISQDKFDELRCTEVLPGDVLISRLNLPIGRACVVPDLGGRIITSVDNVITRPDDGYSRPYLAYMLSSASHFANMEILARGTTMQRISRSTLGQVRFAFPSFDEQTTIAGFLDRETAKIDALVAEQEQLITLLKEKRQAVISHAVTKGLDPSVPMKDSGVEWLGEVPAHWGISRLKNMSPEVTVGVVVEPSKYYCEDGIPALRSLNVMPMDIRQEGYVYFSAESNELLAKSKLQVGDLVAVRSGQPGTTAVVPNELDGCNCIDLIIIRKPAMDDARFMAWYLNSDAAIRQFTEGSGGAIQQHFNVGTAMNLLLTRPPAEEQLRIVAEIDSRTQEIDQLLSEAVLSIELMRERRSALVSAAVTGQIDVRGLANQQAA